MPTRSTASWLRRVDPAVAEDLLADVFTTAFSARLRMFPHASNSVLPWLYGIAGNVVRSHRRRGASAAATVAALSGNDETYAALDWDAVDARVDAGALSDRLARRPRRALTRASANSSCSSPGKASTPAEAGLALGLSPTGRPAPRLHRARQRSQSAHDIRQRTS